MSSRLALCLAILAVAGCGVRSFVTQTPNGTFMVTGSSAHISSGAEEKARLVKNAEDYCKHRDKSSVVVSSTSNDAKPGNLAAPGTLARATVEFRCQ